MLVVWNLPASISVFFSWEISSTSTWGFSPCRPKERFLWGFLAKIINQRVSYFSEWQSPFPLAVLSFFERPSEATCVSVCLLVERDDGMDFWERCSERNWSSIRLPLDYLLTFLGGQPIQHLVWNCFPAPQRQRLPGLIILNHLGRRRKGCQQSRTNIVFRRTRLILKRSILQNPRHNRTCYMWTRIECFPLPYK